MGGDKKFPWLILLRRQFLIKLISRWKEGAGGGEEVGESAMEGLALEKEGDRVEAMVTYPMGSREASM